VETVGKVIQTYELREFNTNDRQGKVASMLIGDETGNIRAVMWGNQADNIRSIKPGAVVKIVNAYVRENNGYMEIHLNDKSQVIINPANETVELKQKLSPRKQISELTESDAAAEILGTVVQIFDPKFFEVCPECSKRLKVENDVFLCQEHDKVIPDYSYVMNLIVDDGTENIRTVFFRDSMEKLLRMGKDRVMNYKKNPETFEEVKTDLLGTILKISGRVKKNLFFDRLEFVANDVNLNPDPEDEIKRLDEEIKKAKDN
jgi:replication factor A1